ncbi:MAG: NAD(P)/FAD-dependent oxidoreductase [Actinomycetota bacterium]|nr:NAD(P)/FAD-dependent oxidoreductase [Actinomycetota bacterium]
MNEEGPGDEISSQGGDPGGGGAPFDPDAVHAKYLAERDKRLVEGRAAIRDLTGDGVFARYQDDPFTPFQHRDRIRDDVDVVVIGAGIGGIVSGAELRRAGIAKIRLIDSAGGIGGTWYWNRYPGVMCDVESYIYMPLLEDLDYIPSRKYAFGDEIRSHLERIAEKFDLVRDALFHTVVERSEWDESDARWVLHTDRGDEIRARYVVMAVGILNLLKLPDIPGMELFKGRSFHTSRWDYEYTGGDMHSPMTNLADKAVGIIGTGASAIQCVGPLALSSRHLFVFQRTPSAIGERNNRPTPPDFAQPLGPGWQRERMGNFHSVLDGQSVPDLVDDGWTHHEAKVWSPRFEPGLSPEEFMLRAEEQDFEIMEQHRRRIDQIVEDPEVAEILKPYYRYLCKRPCFHDEYLPAFNRANLTLVDCPAGIERVTEEGLVCNGRAFSLDCIVYATGFEPEVTPFPRRAGHDIVGRRGVRLADKWADGPATFHGMMTSGFPNMFMMPAPGQQSVVTVNATFLNVEGAEHIAETIRLLDQRDIRIVDVRPEAEAAYVDGIVGSFRDVSAVMEACTPSRLNNEGNPKAMNPKSGAWGGGRGDLFGWLHMLETWRRAGDFEGLEIS